MICKDRAYSTFSTLISLDLLQHSLRVLYFTIYVTSSGITKLMEKHTYLSQISRLHVQYWSLLNWRNLRLRCGSVAVAVNWMFVLFHYFLRCLRTLYIVWSYWDAELFGVSPGSKLFATFLNIAKYFKMLRCGCGAVAFIFSIYLKPVLYLYRVLILFVLFMCSIIIIIISFLGFRVFLGCCQLCMLYRLHDPFFVSSKILLFK